MMLATVWVAPWAHGPLASTASPQLLNALCGVFAASDAMLCRFRESTTIAHGMHSVICISCTLVAWARILQASACVLRMRLLGRQPRVLHRQVASRGFDHQIRMRRLPRGPLACADRPATRATATRTIAARGTRACTACAAWQIVWPSARAVHAAPTSLSRSPHPIAIAPGTRHATCPTCAARHRAASTTTPRACAPMRRRRLDAGVRVLRDANRHTHHELRLLPSPSGPAQDAPSRGGARARSAYARPSPCQRGRLNSSCSDGLRRGQRGQRGRRRRMR